MIAEPGAFREAFAHAAIGMALVSLDGRFLRVNAALCRIVGYAEQDLTATSFQAITHPDDLETDLEYVRRLVAGDITHYHMQKRYIRPDGGVAPILLSVALVRRPDGEPSHFIAQMQDLAVQHRLEAERLAAERRVAELERQASMNLIAASIAHDFNNRLASVMGFATLAAEHVEPGSPVARCLAEIEKAAEGAAELAHQMLAYAGAGSYVVMNVDVATALRQAAQQALALFPEIRLEVEPLGPLPEAAGDAAQIQQALVNVVVNACEAVLGTGGFVRVGASAARDARSIQIRVTDTGVGIAPSLQTRIFDPFFTTKFIGRGLGLSAALGILKAHHGTIEVESAPGAGTRMTISIPVATPATRRACASPDAGPAAETRAG